MRTLALAAAARDLVICGVVRCEVGRALRQPETVKRFQDFWNVMINIPTDNRLWEEVERTLWTLDRKGNVLSLTDVVIACSAMRINAVVLTFDSDFSRIPGLRAANRLDF